jgi:hypothetical protein
VAVRRKTIKRTVGPALYQVMEPGDQIIAGTFASAGLGPWLDMAGFATSTVLLAVGFPGTAPGTSPEFLWYLAPNLLPLVMVFMRKPVFVAVTQRQLICYRLSRMDNEPARPLFCAPLLAVRVTSLGRSMPGWRSVRYDGPGAEGRSLRLNVHGRWRRDLDEVLAALQAQGASVAPEP